MYRMRTLLFAMGLALAACRGSGDEARAETSGLTPEDWDRFAGRYPPCTLDSAPVDSTSLVTWSLPIPTGARLALPAAFRAVASPGRGARRWISPDSSRLELRVVPEPESAMATSGSLRVTPEGECALTVGGRRALVTRIRLTDTLTQRVGYAASVDAFVRPGVALSAWVESPVVGTRDAVLRAIGSLDVRADE
jgi:hypothetical protein